MRGAAKHTKALKRKRRQGTRTQAEQRALRQDRQLTRLEAEAQTLRLLLGGGIH